MNVSGVSLYVVNRMYANWRQYIQNLRDEEAEEKRRQGTLQNKREGGYRRREGGKRKTHYSHKKRSVIYNRILRDECRSSPKLSCMIAGVVERVLKRIINRTPSDGFLVWYEICTPAAAWNYTSTLYMRMRTVVFSSVEFFFCTYAKTHRYETVADIKEERVLQAQEAVETAKRALEAELENTKKQVLYPNCTLV